MRQPMVAFAAVITLILMSSAIMAQDLLLSPKWKRDETRTLYMSQKRTMPGMNEEGEVVDVVSEYKTSSKVKVYDITPEMIMISIDHENVILPMVRPYFATGLPGELDPYKRMIIRYKVDRQTGTPVLLNASDLLEFAQRASTIAMRTLRRTDPEASAELEQHLAPLTEQFKDPHRVEEYFGQYFSFLTDAFGKPLTHGKPLEQLEMEVDPFGAPGDSVAVRTVVTLEQSTSDQATIKMVQSLAADTRTVPTKGSQKTRPANDQLTINTFSQEMNFTVDLKTTWPTRMSLNSNVSFTNGLSISEAIDIEVR